ncbi:MFS transporter [Streptomyces alkaliphilus]|uniref:MFS transporter n=1 Tax=Streptomyces alkaliphilus TaxID=1472722 RepID=UPI003F67055B
MNTSSAPESGGRAGRREMIGLAVLSLPTILLALDMSVLYMALPHLGADLGASSVQQLWIIDIYGFMIAGLLVTMGSIGDRIGRRKLLLIGAAAFAAASVLAAYSSSAEMLIAARALLGIAGATLMPSTLSLLTHMFKDPKQQAMAIGVWMGCFMAGTMLGPVIGGAMLEFFWWGSVFLLGVPVTVLLLLIAPRTLPEYRNPDAGRTDLPSVALSLAGVLPLIYGLKEISREGLDAPAVLAVVAGVVFGLLFVRRQRTLAEPLLNLRLFRHRTFSSAVVITSFSGFLSGSYLFVYMYLQLVEGLSPLRAALWMLPAALATLISLQLGPLLAQRLRPAHVMAGGLTIVAIGYYVITHVGGSDGLGLLVGGLIAVAAGIGPASALSAGLVMGSVPQESAGAAAAVNETSMEMGVATGVAVIGMVGMSVYRDRIGETMPSGLPADVAETARESAAGAATAVQQLGGTAAAELNEAANNALAGALGATAWASLAIVLALAVVALAALRHVPPTGTETPQSPSAEDTPPQSPSAEDTPPVEPVVAGTQKVGAATGTEGVPTAAQP